MIEYIDYIRVKITIIEIQSSYYVNNNLELALK